MIVSTNKFTTEEYHLSVQLAAKNGNYAYLRITTGYKLFEEELEEMDTEQLFDLYLIHKVDKIGDYAKPIEWNPLMADYIQEGRELDQLEDERQSI
jgi:predicted aldo/keto reductase-like oxidoreductase